LRLILIESLVDAYFQLLEACTQDEVKQRFWGYRGLASIILSLNGLPKLAMAKCFLNDFKTFEGGKRDMPIDCMICMAKYI
jgi:hypothetical protein